MLAYVLKKLSDADTYLDCDAYFHNEYQIPHTTKSVHMTLSESQLQNM